MKIKYRSPTHLDRKNAQLGTKHGVHCHLTMGLMVGTTCVFVTLVKGVKQIRQSSRLHSK